MNSHLEIRSTKDSVKLAPKEILIAEIRRKLSRYRK